MQKTQKNQNQIQRINREDHGSFVRRSFLYFSFLRLLRNFCALCVQYFLQCLCVLMSFPGAEPGARTATGILISTLLCSPLALEKVSVTGI
jgi:hypothetical protein